VLRARHSSLPPSIAANVTLPTPVAVASRRGHAAIPPFPIYPRSMKFSPTFLGCVLSSLAENLRFAATVEMLSLSVAIPGAREREARSGVDRSSF
jgi:hypothetical protein